MSMIETSIRGSERPMARLRAPQVVGDVAVATFEPQQIKILVVDDDAGDCALIERTARHMSSFDVQIAAVGSLDAARFCLAAEDFDVILLDCSLGLECGIELLTEPGRQLAEAVTVLVTGSLNSEIELDALARGASACIAKDDLTPHVMQTTIRQAMRTRSIERSMGLVSPRAGRRSAPIGMMRPLAGATVSQQRHGVELRSMLECVVAELRRDQQAGLLPAFEVELAHGGDPVHVAAPEALVRETIERAIAGAIGADRQGLVRASVRTSSGEAVLVVMSIGNGGMDGSYGSAGAQKVPVVSWPLAPPPLARSALDLVVEPAMQMRNPARDAEFPADDRLVVAA